MALVDNLASGRYTMTYNAVDVGMTKEGATLEITPMLQALSPSDAHGQTIYDLIYQGANCYIGWTAPRWMAGFITPLWPYGAALGTISSAAAPIGRIGSDIASALVMTVVANTPAAANGVGPATLTASKSVLAPNFNVNILFDARLRETPIRLQMLPYVSTNVVHFTTTAPA